MARKARPGRVRYRRRKNSATATMPTARDRTWPETMLIRPRRAIGLSPARLSGNATGSPSLNVWESTSVMIIPMPMDRTMVALMSTWDRFSMTF